MDELEKTRAPFNMALSTLEKLQNVLVELTRFSVSGNQNEKYRLTLQFHIQAIPIIFKKESMKRMEELKKKLRELRPSKIIYRDGYGNTTRIEPNFVQELDFKLDDIIQEIQVLLQDEGYFMPPKEDEDLY